MIKDRLKLLDATADIFRDTDLGSSLVIACQHILAPQFDMFEYLFLKGLKPNNTYLLGKCYSTHFGTFLKFKTWGVNVHPGSIKFDSHISFDKLFEKEVKNFLDDVIAKVKLNDYEKIIVLDDGGYLISLINKTIENLSNFVGVEQTTSGYARLSKEKLRLPVINVAKSKAKLEIEAPFIAETFVEKLEKELDKIKIRPKNILVVGAGPIGNNIHKLLKRNSETFKYDLEKHLSDFKDNDLKSILPRFDLIIGSTGTTIIDDSSYKYLKRDTILASASSSDREFDAVNLRKLVPRTSNCHNIIWANEIYLLNCGFPVTFDGSECPTAPEKIQITLACLYAALLLGKSRDYSVGIVNLDENIQNKIIEYFLEILRNLE